MVRDKLRAFGYNTPDNGITVEEQKSEIAKVKNLLSKASKNAKGNAGYPEFIISNKKDTAFLVVFECKPDVTKHESASRDKPVATRFAAVSTIAEKKRQNIHYQKRTQQLVNLLESFHFSDIGDQLAGHEELALSFKALLADRIPAFRESLWAILDTLNQYLFEFRKIEERAKRVRAFALHLNRNPDWAPRAWDEVAEPADWLCGATPLEIQTNPNILTQGSEELLAEIARSIPDAAGAKSKTARPEGSVDDEPGNQEIKPPESPIRRAVRLYFKEAGQSREGISARNWWATNPIILGNIKEDIWLLRVLAEHDNKGKAGNLLKPVPSSTWPHRAHARALRERHPGELIWEL